MGFCCWGERREHCIPLIEVCIRHVRSFIRSGTYYQAWAAEIPARSAWICWISGCWISVTETSCWICLHRILFLHLFCTSTSPFRKPVGPAGEIPPTAISIAPSSRRKGNSHRSIVCISGALFPGGQIDFIPSSARSSSSHCPVRPSPPTTMMIPPDTTKDLLTFCPTPITPSCLLGQLSTCPEPVNLTSAAIELTGTPPRPCSFPLPCHDDYCSEASIYLARTTPSVSSVRFTICERGILNLRLKVFINI